MPSYTERSLSFKLKKVLRYTRMYGVRRTLNIVSGQYHMKRVYENPPPSPTARAKCRAEYP